MAYVTITKDLTEVKDKVAFGLTKRQIVLNLGQVFGNRHISQSKPSFLKT